MHTFLQSFFISYVILHLCILLLQVKKSGPKHTCGSFNTCGDTMASNKWVAERSVDLLRDNPTMGPKDLQDEMKKKYKIHVPYDRVFRGKERALDMINGSWDDSYDLLPTYRDELLKSAPGSVVELDTEENDGDVCFRRFFVSLKPCIDGFCKDASPTLPWTHSFDRKVQRSVGISCCSGW